MIAEHFSSRVAIDTDEHSCETARSADLLRSALAPWVAALRDARAGGVFKLIFTEVRDFPALADFWSQEVVQPMHPLVSRIVARGIARGEFRRIDPDLVVRSLVLPVIMTCLVRHALGGCVSEAAETDPPERFSQHFEFVLEGLNHRPPG